MSAKGMTLTVLTTGFVQAMTKDGRNTRLTEHLSLWLREVADALNEPTQGDRFEYVGYVDVGDVLKLEQAPANNNCHVYRKMP